MLHADSLPHYLESKTLRQVPKVYLRILEEDE